MNELLDRPFEQRLWQRFILKMVKKFTLVV